MITTKYKLKENMKYFLSALCMVFFVNSYAKQFPNVGKVSSPNTITADACLPATGQIDLDINNVRARILGGGDMWWDQGLGIARYEIPKDSKKYSLFASSLWIGGIDAGGQLKVAAQTYRQTGNDMWPGPLDTTGQANISKTTCDLYDRHWKITKKEVEEFRQGLITGVNNPTAAINAWPGNPVVGTPANHDNYLAPFYDSNGDGKYKPADGDYPNYNFSSGGAGDCEGYLYGDQTIWWVVNDKGNIHTETGGQQIGIEIQCQAFGFQTGDEVNNMTFYQYKIINRSSFQMNNTYFGMWIDADLGNAYDDAVGCDVPRGVAFTYNYDENDETNIGYGLHPPAIGVDFFKGPLRDPDGVDNPLSETNNGLGYGDGIIDNERWGMEKMIVFQNNSSPQGNPFNATHIYNYLRAKWKDGTPLTFGGNGTGGTPCNYMYPWNTDPLYSTQDWRTAATADLRTVQSAGPFTLKPGAVNFVTTGAVWARANSTAVASVATMIEADKKAQNLFDNCFKIVDGPTAPDMTIQELDQEVILTLSNPKSSNNYKELYKEKSPNVSNPLPIPGSDAFYRFEGYKIYQLINDNVTADNLSDPSLAQLVAQCDLKNNVSTIINRVYDPLVGADKSTIQVEGQNAGLKHSFRFTEDAFNVGSKLTNYKKYYYMVVAYAYNNYATKVGDVDTNKFAQKEPYLAGRLNVVAKLAIPHIPAVEQNGTVAQSMYGSGPVLTREEGQGNGGNFLDLTQESINEIVSKEIGAAPVRRISYKGGSGPVNIKVIDPLNVPDAEFELRIIPNDTSVVDGDTTIVKGEDNRMRFAKWVLYKMNNGVIEEAINSEQAINIANEQIIPKWGLSVTALQVENPGSNKEIDNNGLIGGTVTFSGDGQIWLDGVKDEDGGVSNNWIRSGTESKTAETFPTPTYNDWVTGPSGGPKETFDEFQFYEGVVGGTWAPYRLTSTEPFGPMMLVGQNYYATGGTNITGANLNFKSAQANRLQNLASVDVVFTSDKSKWTRCPVIETGIEQQLNENLLGLSRAPMRGEMRSHKSVDKNGKTVDDAGVNVAEATLISGEGMGWFPGYAINVETGERLNVAFGESSYMYDQNGRDMLWNPTSTVRDEYGRTRFGGLHFVYVFNHNSYASAPGATNPSPNLMPAYDGGQYIHDKLALASAEPVTGTLYTLKQVWRDCIWANFPLLAKDHKLFENDATVKLRVTKPYSRFYAANSYNFQYTNPTATQFYGFDPNNTAINENAKNDNDPRYSFSTKNLATLLNQNTTAKNALDLINAVPNPYYAYSDYEETQIDNVVKFTNLPVKCTISIYSVNGILIRQIEKDNDLTFIDWDLKNQSNIPIGSGMYLIHINAPKIGEKTIKWFGALRPIDLNSF